MSKVILRAVADKGTCKGVSLATLKKALVATGYDMARNACHFKRVLKGLVDKGLLKQVTSKGASGSFRLGKKQASKPKLRVKRRRRRRQRPGQRVSGQSRSGQHHFGRRRSLLGSKQGHKRLVKGARRAAKCHRN
ncbi:putative spermatid-specific linker histone H1-like protein [Saguinus oedipus]|uniref:Spermatid-specific linker histone H1-like protein n=1 Tax=Saguinus oedipus TaxID=9490 RepID=A0ABQ9VQN6_SAGOE|nr:putative spermatid-specific linker histone H1-like protein [Saguinus oedipus]